jgi:hypothetical protein
MIYNRVMKKNSIENNNVGTLQDILSGIKAAEPGGRQ